MQLKCIGGEKPMPSYYIFTFDPVSAVLDFTKSRFLFQFFQPPWVDMQQ